MDGSGRSAPVRGGLFAGATTGTYGLGFTAGEIPGELFGARPSDEGKGGEGNNGKGASDGKDGEGNNGKGGSRGTSHIQIISRSGKDSKKEKKVCPICPEFVNRFIIIKNMETRLLLVEERSNYGGSETRR